MRPCWRWGGLIFGGIGRWCERDSRGMLWLQAAGLEKQGFLAQAQDSPKTSNFQVISFGCVSGNVAVASIDAGVD